MQALIEVILPVFLVIGFGYLASARNWISQSGTEALMGFAQNFAIPSLLFAGIARMDLSQNFHAPLLLSFYAGALASGLVTFLGARYLFQRPLIDCVAIGFIGLFSNSLLLGVPITERAYGSSALVWNYAIISLHSPMLYAIGITAMEAAKARGQALSLPRLARQISGGLIRNPLVIGIALGWAVNISHAPLPQPLWDAVGLMNRAAIPVALFGLGGVLVRYRPEGDMRVIFWAMSASLLLHPLITYGLGRGVFHLDIAPLRAATLSAAMAPGVNTYLFANLYGAAKRVAASSVLLGTALSIVTIWLWLAVLP